MQRYFIQLSYKGTKYHGWQMQQNAHTVQAELELALNTVFEEKTELVGCGRTDTGVHARDYWAHFDSARVDLMEPELLFKLNKFLPEDIAVKRIIKVNETAHARFDAISRTYKYFISLKKDPFNFDKSYYLYGLLDLQKMNKAAAMLFNYTDFTSFSKTGTQVKTNVCKLIYARWERNEDMLIFTITADRFLRNMVRAIVGTMIAIGRNKLSLDDFIRVIENKNRSDAGFSVPANGLFLEKVEYPEGMKL